MKQLAAGEVGYIATGLKTVRECRVGDTVTLKARPASEPLPGYQAIKPMVFAGIYPSDNEDYHTYRDTIDELSFAKIANTSRLAFQTAWLLANDDDRPPPPR